MVISFFFIADLGFITLDSSVKKIVKAFKKVAKKIIEQRRQNIVTYDAAKIEVVLFSKSH